MSRASSISLNQFRFTVRIRMTLTPSTGALHALFLHYQPISHRPTDCLTFKPYPRNFTSPALVYVPSHSEVCHQGPQRVTMHLSVGWGRGKKPIGHNTTNRHAFREFSLHYKPLSNMLSLPSRSKTNHNKSVEPHLEWQSLAGGQSRLTPFI